MLNKQTRKIDLMTSEDQRSFNASIASETPVLQVDQKTKQPYWEVLSHEPNAVQVLRGKDSVKLKWDHQDSTLIGVAEAIKVDPVSRTTRANIRFGNTPQAEGLRKDVVEGIATDLSVGYSYNNKDVTVDKSTTPETRTIHKFQINEVSVVPDGADERVGFGRSLGDPGVKPPYDPFEVGETGLPAPTDNEDSEDQQEEAVDNVTEAEEELRALKAKVEELETRIAKRPDVSSKEGEEKYGDVDFADEKNKKYPLSSAEKVKAAASYWGMPKNKAEYSEADQKIISAKIAAAEKKFGIGERSVEKEDCREKEIGLSPDASPEAKAFDEALDNKHNVKEGSPEDLAIDEKINELDSRSKEEDDEELRAAKNISGNPEENQGIRADVSISEENTTQTSQRTTPIIEENTMENELNVTQPAPTTNFRSQDLANYSATKMIRGLMSGGLTGFEREVAQEIHSDTTIPTQVFANAFIEEKKRAFALNGGAAAGQEFNIPLFGGYLDLLLPETLFGKLGCPSMNLAQPVELPGGDVPTPTFGTETGFITTPATETDPTSRNILFSPKVAISQIALTRTMLESGTPGVDAYLVNLLRKRHASGFEDAAWAQILGEISQTYDYTAGGSNHDVSVDFGAGLLDLVQVVANQIDEPEGAGFATNHVMFNKLSQVKRSANLTVPVAGSGMIWDRKAVASARIKAISSYQPVVFGAWEYCQLASFGSGVNLVIDQISKALSDQVLITGQAHYDAHVTQPIAFAKTVNAL